MKATSVAPSNLAFIKYWGRKDEALRLPTNGSISMNLSNLLTTTTVQFSAELAQDAVAINGQDFVPDAIEAARVSRHLDRLRELAGLRQSARVVSENNFPSSTGLSSSASSFAALTVAAAAAAGLELPEKELSILARQGSGSACRSIPDGFVEWLDGDTSDTSFAVSLYPPQHWPIADVVAIVSREKKLVSSSKGQLAAASSPFFAVRLGHMADKLKLARAFIQQRDFTRFGELIEAEAVEMHAIMLTSTPSLMYWLPGSVKIMRLARQWRGEGLEVYFSVNTGQDVHLICRPEDVEALTARLRAVPDVTDILINTPAPGARLVEEHLF
ncbi:MAG: diphosphomevalonate decarboxylase [Anaerolineae bacterium]